MYLLACCTQITEPCDCVPLLYLLTMSYVGTQCSSSRGTLRCHGFPFTLQRRDRSVSQFTDMLWVYYSPVRGPSFISEAVLWSNIWLCRARYEIT